MTPIRNYTVSDFNEEKRDTIVSEIKITDSFNTNNQFCADIPQFKSN